MSENQSQNQFKLQNKPAKLILKRWKLTLKRQKPVPQWCKLTQNSSQTNFKQLKNRNKPCCTVYQYNQFVIVQYRDPGRDLWRAVSWPAPSLVLLQFPHDHRMVYRLISTSTATPTWPQPWSKRGLVTCPVKLTHSVKVDSLRQRMPI